MNNTFTITTSPHLHEGSSVRSVMWDVVVALMPALIASVYFFGIDALLLVFYGVISATLTEALILFLRKKPVAISDGSAVVTGILVSFNVHAGVPWWIPVVGAAFAIAIGKQAFGGLGNNIVNPALLGRVFLVASWPQYMTSGWVKTTMDSINGITRNTLEIASEQITGATPLGVFKSLRDPIFIESLGENSETIINHISYHLTSMPTLARLYWGNVAGCIGEVSAFALILGGIYLLIRKIIEWKIPFFYLLTVFLMTFLLNLKNGVDFNIPLFHLLSGGLMLGAIFMATDMVTSPISKNGRIIFGIGCGFLTVLIRLYGNYPEGVSYSILIMNLLSPLIDRFTYSKQFGGVKK